MRYLWPNLNSIIQPDGLFLSLLTLSKLHKLDSIKCENDYEKWKIYKEVAMAYFKV